MPTISWTIGTAGGDISADALVGELYTPSIGERIRPRFSLSESAHDALRPYVEAAMEQTIQTGVNQSGKTWYREDLSEFGVSSLVVSLDPPDVLAAGAVWAVILGGTDLTDPARVGHSWELECRVLADLADYADRTAVSNDLESQVI